MTLKEAARQLLLTPSDARVLTHGGWIVAELHAAYVGGHPQPGSRRRTLRPVEQRPWGRYVVGSVDLEQWQFSGLPFSAVKRWAPIAAEDARRILLETCEPVFTLE